MLRFRSFCGIEVSDFNRKGIWSLSVAEGGGGSELGWLDSETGQRDVTMGGFNPGELRPSTSFHGYSS